MSAKIEKTIARQQEKIAEGQFYEAHQQLRVIASRYVKQSNWDAAINILSSGAGLLLQAGQGGSGGDLCLFLLEVYHKAETKPDAASKAKLLSLLRSFPQDEPTKKRFIAEMIGWSAKYGEFPAGDPELHHVAGTICADDGEAYEAERHFVYGTRDSPEHLVKLEYEWYTEDSAHTAPLYAARAILPYLLAGNVRAANQCLLLFTTRLSQSNTSLGMQEVSSSSSDIRVYPSLPLLNFLGLLLLAVTKGSPDLFRMLKSHYKSNLDDVPGWSDALNQIGEMYFGIKIPSQSNPLMDMMGMFMGGGGGGGNKPSRRVEAPAPPPALD
ncbi:uncharacterized protein K452DRAFT_225671 [Aplosporella prunicola CBS 121167]|uniref:DUF410-domain-containing protein n=1 Tax=Aplosporella prunicola CBS 121167 TaxID=1176127 RepID=A0A6A6BIE6_9PEZI|nr:uncharacterized protein K452DRAFT_225671 [Aplosporella prunicola CBS 121167]KAF2143024.1 hypothetical protein K452DRAFT_225671 [Aplosporella prunicola CBS 121167]